MKLICTQENLSKALATLDRVVGKQSSLPILSNILFETHQGRLKLSATNLEIGIIATIGAKIEAEGKFAVPAKVLAQFVHNLPAGEVIELEASREKLKITSGGAHMQIKVLDGKDFPIIPEYKKPFLFDLPAQSLKSALSRLLFAVSQNESRAELTGIYFGFEEEKLFLAATDSFRLGEETLTLKNPSPEYETFRNEHASLILPTSTVQEIQRLIESATEGVKLALEENQIFFEVEGTRIVSRLISGKYPDYQQIIPKSFTLEVQMEKEALVRALKIAGSLSSFVSGEIALVIDPEKESATLLSQSKEIGESTNTLPLTVSQGQEAMTFVFHPRYLMEGLGALRTDIITFCANTPVSPVMLKEASEEASDYLYIIMPIRKEYA